MIWCFSRSPQYFPFNSLRKGKVLRQQFKSLKMKAMITIFLLQIMIISTSRFCSVNSDKSPNNNATALYVFGDSLLDSGNNNLLPTLAKADFTPYGMSFVRGATGRFTNGRTVADFIAEFLGLPYAPPYLSIVRTPLQQDELTGINFASGSCGILTETGSDLGKCLSFPEQVNYFEKMVHEQLPIHYERSDELLDYLAKSILIISVGSNDYINNYLDTEHYNTSQRYTPESYAGLLIDNLRTQFQRLYNLGARKVIMFEIGPIGCMPSSTRRFKHEGQCVEDFNRLAVIFNDRLALMLQNLTSSLEGSNFVLGRVHRLGYDEVIHPSNYGLSDSINPCCVTWLNGTSACIPELWALTCQDPNKHYFFDGFHLSETVYNTIATRCFNGSNVCIPNNIRDLVQQL